MNNFRMNATVGQSAQFRMLSENQCEQIIETVYKVLEVTGCDVHHEGARKLLLDAGCKVEGIQVKVPSYLIKKALATAPKQITIYDREGNPALDLSARNGKTYFEAGLLNLYRIDSRTGERRVTTRQDVAEAGLVIEALPNIDVASGLASISDCPEGIAEVYEVRTLLEHTTKPIQLWNTCKENFLAQAELCAAAAGGMEEFVAKPFVVAGSASFPLLGHAKEDLDKLLCMFEMGIPSCYVSSGILGFSAPMTMAGALVTTLADTLVGLLLSQLTKEGCPFIASSYIDIMDMGSLAFCMSTPEFIQGGAAAADVFRYLDIPFSVHVAGTDSPIFDEQAAFDISAQAYTGILAGVNLGNFIGFMESAMSSSLAALVYADEAIDYIRKILGGFEISGETLAEAVIREVKPGGSFLGEEHTIENLRTLWVPKNFIRTNYENWEKDGKRDYLTRANEKVVEIIEQGIRKPLKPAVLAKMDAIIEAFEKRQ